MEFEQLTTFINVEIAIYKCARWQLCKLPDDTYVSSHIEYGCQVQRNDAQRQPKYKNK